MEATKPETFVTMPPHLQFLGILSCPDGDGPRPQMRGAKITRENGVITATVTDGRVAGILKSNTDAVVEPDRFPDVQAKVPKDEPLLTIKVSPKHLIRVLRVAQEIVGDAVYGTVSLEFRGPEKVIVVRAADGLKTTEFVGFCMPLIGG